MKTYIIILAIFAAISLAAIFALSILKRRYAADEAKTEAITAAKALCEKLLSQVALALFTEAERQYGDGTGKLKFSSVMTQFLAMLPDWVKDIIDTDWLTAKLEILLLEAKDLWEKNDKLLNG